MYQDFKDEKCGSHANIWRKLSKKTGLQTASAKASRWGWAWYSNMGDTEKEPLWLEHLKKRDNVGYF